MILKNRRKAQITVQVVQIYPYILLNLSDKKSIKIESFTFKKSSLEAIVNNEKITCDYLVFGNFLHIKVDNQHKYLEFAKNLSVTQNNYEPDKNIKAEMPGTVISVSSEATKKVEVGQILMVVESMKIQTNIVSEVNGIIEKIYYSENESFERGSILISISET